MHAYVKCPVQDTKSFRIRLVEQGDAEALFQCYHDKDAVQRMNDDNCGFGFYVETQEQMLHTIDYWLDFYKKQCFIRFAIEDRMTKKAVGTIEGFGGDTGVLRIDLASKYEKAEDLAELFHFAAAEFHNIFGNKALVTKAIPEAVERRKALELENWEYIDRFREYADYYRIQIS